MKICGKCKIQKELSEFTKNKNRKDGLQNSCKQCHRLYVNNHYANNKQYYVDKARVNNLKVKEAIREKKNKPCMDCNQSYPYYVMDFDHRDGKEFTISTKGKGYGWARVLAEIEKCDVVCSNCHRKRTHTRWEELQKYVS